MLGVPAVGHAVRTSVALAQHRTDIEKLRMSMWCSLPKLCLMVMNVITHVGPPKDDLAEPLLLCMLRD